MRPLDLDADLVELAPALSPTCSPVPLREMAFRVDAWTPHESERLRALFLDDTAIGDIALAIGRGRAAIAERIALLGLRRNSTRAWTELDDTELTCRYGCESTATIASDLGRSCSAVYARARLLDLSESNLCTAISGRSAAMRPARSTSPSAAESRSPISPTRSVARPCR